MNIAAKYKELPPTPADTKLREKHTKASVVYNLKHAVEHVTPIEAHLKGLSQSQPGGARALASKVVAQIAKHQNKIKKLGAK